jgi:hypothetical protein
VVQEQIVAAIRAGAAAIGLTQGAIHAECRVNDGGVYILEIAARPIGGLCARALTFVDGHQHDISLEELLLRDALREPTQDWRREQQASGVMMIPIPRGGILRRSEGLEEARAVDCVTAVEITAKVDQRLVPLPEGSSYLGFIFAKAGSAGEVERALRTAHGKLHFVIERGLPVV